MRRLDMTRTVSLCKRRAPACAHPNKPKPDSLVWVGIGREAVDLLVAVLLDSCARSRVEASLDDVDIFFTNTLANADRRLSVCSKM